MGQSDDLASRLTESRYSLAQLLLGSAGVLYGLFASLTLVVIAGLILGIGGIAKLLARRAGVSQRTFTVLNVGPILLLAGYFAVAAAVAGSWGFAIIAVTVGSGAAAVLLPNSDAALHESIGVVGFGAFALYFAVAGDLLAAAVGLLFVTLNGKNLLERRRAET